MILTHGNYEIPQLLWSIYNTTLLSFGNKNRQNLLYLFCAMFSIEYFIVYIKKLLHFLCPFTHVFFFSFQASKIKFIVPKYAQRTITIKVELEEKVLDYILYLV
jgi:hypothetical protein